MDINKIQRKIKRLESQIEKLSNEHEGKEASNYTYWGGFSLGYLKGKLCVLEELCDECEPPASMTDEQIRKAFRRQ